MHFPGVPGRLHGEHVLRGLGGEREGDDGRAAPRAPPHRLRRRRVQGRHAARHEARQEPQVAGEVWGNFLKIPKKYFSQERIITSIILCMKCVIFVFGGLKFM